MRNISQAPRSRLVLLSCQYLYRRMVGLTDDESSTCCLIGELSRHFSRGTQKSHQKPVTTVGAVAEIQTTHLSDTSLP
jgi:hypothetical protein